MDRGKYLTTGEVAKLMHITKNTLFHYDQIGLFSPEIVGENEYRYYSLQQMEILNTIILLKELGMPLKEIKTFLEGRNPEKLLELYKKEQKQIRQQLKYLNDLNRWIQHKSENVQKCLASEIEVPYIREKPEQYYILRDVETATDAGFIEKISELTELYESRNHNLRYEIGYVQYEKNIGQKQYDNYQNVILIMKQKPEGMDYQCFPKGKYLTIYFKGHWSGVGRAYEKLLKYAKENQLVLANCYVEADCIDQLAVEQVDERVMEISVQILSEK